MSDADDPLGAPAAGNERVAALVRGVRSDLDRYLVRIGRGPTTATA